MRLRISIRGRVRQSVGPSVGPSVRTHTRRILCRVSGLVIRTQYFRPALKFGGGSQAVLNLFVIFRPKIQLQFLKAGFSLL